MNHWAIGWVDYLLVRPGSHAAAIAQDWARSLADYPLADEGDYGNLVTEDNHPGDGYCYCSNDESCCGDPSDCPCNLPRA